MTNPDFDDSELYDADGSYNLVRGRRYEVIINMGDANSFLCRGGITLQLEETVLRGYKTLTTTAMRDIRACRLSCIVGMCIPYRFQSKRCT